MIPIYKSKRSTRTDEFRQLLPKTDIQTIEYYLFTKLITKKEKEMKVKIKKRRKFSKNTKKYFRKK